MDFAQPLHHAGRSNEGLCEPARRVDIACHSDRAGKNSVTLLDTHKQAHGSTYALLEGTVVYSPSLDFQRYTTEGYLSSGMNSRGFPYVPVP